MMALICLRIMYKYLNGIIPCVVCIRELASFKDICLTRALHSLAVLNQMDFFPAFVKLEHMKLPFLCVAQMIKYQQSSWFSLNTQTLRDMS